MAQIIKIKRSSTTSVPSSLDYGEMAYTEVAGVKKLFVGQANGSTAFEVGGQSYALLASPAFTGIPTAPTAIVGTNTTQLATTAFVLANSLTNTLTSAQIFVGNSSNIATGVALSGDATISNTGVLSVVNSTNLKAGVAGAIPYQSGVGVTGFSATGTSGQVLTSNGTNAPTWTSKNVLGDVKTGLQSVDHSGWLLWTNGRSLSRTTYVDLWGFVQTNNLIATGLFGVGDGSTTFTLGDINGRSIGITGSGSGLTTRALGDRVGAETHVLTTSEMPSHTHDASMKWSPDNSHNHSNNNGIFSEASNGAPGGEYLKGLTSTGSNAAHNNMQPSVFLNFFIYTGQ